MRSNRGRVDRSDDSALRVVPDSHRVRFIRTPAHQVRVLHPPKGSAVIFEQRITHRGRLASDAGLTTDGRVMISLGFGRRNQWTDEFEAGTKARQANTSTCERLVRARLTSERVASAAERASVAKRYVCELCGPGLCKMTGNG